MEKMNIRTQLKNEWYNDEKISNEDLVVYTMLSKHRIWKDESNGYSYYISNINDITNRLIQTNENKNNRRWYGIIKDSIESLIKLDMIVSIHNINHQKINIEQLGNNENFYIKTYTIDNDFFLIKQNEIDRLLKEIKSSKISKFTILRYYIATQRVINCDSRFGYLAQRYITFINDFKTINQYNDILNNNFCLIDNDYVSPQRQLNTTFFGLIGDNENFEYQVKCQVEQNNLVKINKKAMKNKIRDTQKKNYENKNNSDIDINEIDDKDLCELFS